MITHNVTIKNLAAWITDIKEAAKDDTDNSIFWFLPTGGAPFTIIAGWQKMFSAQDLFNNSDLFCCSKSCPEYAMCIKVVDNKQNAVYLDFDSVNMPLDKNGNVDNTCVPLEWDDVPEIVAEFFLHEWERIMREHGNKV